MGLEEQIFNSKSLAKKIEFITIQSSEQREEEIKYKNVNRKQIRFDFNDLAVMYALGQLLRPYGVKEFFENKLAQSNIALLRLWGEKKLAKRGQKFIRSLFMKSPEKFSKVEFANNRSTHIKMTRGIFIISELTNQKTLCLKDDKEDYLSELELFKDKYKAEETRLLMQKDIIEDLTFEKNHQEDEALIGMN